MKAFIFDLDGVLTDTEYLFHETLENLFKNNFSMDIKIDEEVTALIAGRTDVDIYKNLTNHFKVDVTYEKFQEYLKKEDSHKMGDGLEPMEGSIEFLQELKKQGFKTAIASSSYYPSCISKLKSLKMLEYFDQIVTGDKVEKPKPAGDIFVLAAKMLNEQIDNCVVIEDSYAGVMAGKDAGMYVIGYKGSKAIQDTSLSDKEVYAFKEIDLKEFY